MPSQITAVVIETAPMSTHIGGKPKYTSDKIPIGISNPIIASQEIFLADCIWPLN